jgi:hypothetical protein
MGKNARIIDQNIDPPAAGSDRLANAARLGKQGQVGQRYVDFGIGMLAEDPASHGLAAWCVAADENEAVACLSQAKGNEAPDPAGGAGYNTQCHDEGGNAQKAKDVLFLKKKNQKNFCSFAAASHWGLDNRCRAWQEAKVFCFFSSEKKAFLPCLMSERCQSSSTSSKRTTFSAKARCGTR